jgi:glutathione S-transferase
MGDKGHIWLGHPYGIAESPTYRAMNPNGSIPTIDEDGFTLWESNAIGIHRFMLCKLGPANLPRVEEWLARLGERDAFREHVAPRDKHFS